MLTLLSIYLQDNAGHLPGSVADDQLSDDDEGQGPHSRTLLSSKFQKGVYVLKGVSLKVTDSMLSIRGRSCIPVILAIRSSASASTHWLMCLYGRRVQ